jgi:O-methyltransferase involved in polyketide biosynthesis
MNNNIHKIKDTAFWMTGCRAYDESLSHDLYAKYWLNKPSKDRHKLYIEQVSPTENICLSLRNRFFLEEISSFLEQNPGSVFINVGAGFSSYPFLMPKDHRYCEVDYPELIYTKQKKIKEFQEKGIFPERDITYFSADLNKLEDLKRLFSSLTEWMSGAKSFILYEGLIYYLNNKSVLQLFDNTRKIQSQGSRLGIVSWSPKTADYPVYKRFVDFVTKTLGEELNNFNFHDPHAIKEMKGYNPVIQTGYCQLSEKYMSNPLHSTDDVFWEDITILEKTS